MTHHRLFSQPGNDQTNMIWTTCGHIPCIPNDGGDAKESGDQLFECWALGSSITHELLSRALSTSAWTLINTVSVLWYCLWAEWWILFKLLFLFLMAWLSCYCGAAGGLFNTFRDNIRLEMGRKLLKSWLRFAFLWQGDKDAFFRLFVTDVLSWRHSFWTVAGIGSRLLTSKLSD